MQEVFSKIIYALEEYKYNDLIDRDSEMCNHCKRIDCENGTDCSLCIMDKAIEIVKKAADEHCDNWIPCSERMPQESLNSVIGWDACRERCVFVQYLEGQWKLGDWESVDITHWMNVPHQTKGERNRMTDKELYDLAYKEDLTVIQILRKIYDTGYSKAENDYHKQTEKDRKSSYQLGYSMAIDDILHKLNDTGVEITFDLPVEEILGEDVDLDDFAMLMKDAIRAYRKMVIGTIEQMK